MEGKKTSSIDFFKSHLRILIVRSAVFCLYVVCGHVILPHSPCRKNLVIWISHMLFPHKMKAHTQ